MFLVIQIVSSSATYCKFLNPDTTDAADIYDYVTTLDSSDLSLTTSTITIQMRGVDKADNEGGWCTAAKYAMASQESFDRSNVMECLRAIASLS